MFMGMVFQKSGRFFQTVFWNIYGGIDVGGVARFVMGSRGPEHLANGYGVMRCATLHLDCVLAPWGCATLTPGCILALLQGTRCRDDRNHGVALR